MLFRPSYLREGPGIAKDAPPKKGLARFWEILAREFWQVAKVNILFCICALPLVSFGAARAALSRCTMRMVQDVPNDVGYDFRQQLKRNWKDHFFFGLAELFCIGILLVAVIYTPIKSYPVLTGVWLMCGLFTGLFWSYFWPMAVSVQLPVKALIKNAALLSLGCLSHSLPALALQVLLYGSAFFLFPLSLPLLLFLVFGLGSFISSFAAWTDIQKFILNNKGESL